MQSIPYSHKVKKIFFFLWETDHVFVTLESRVTKIKVCPLLTQEVIRERERRITEKKTNG